jgi:hypothetical protein
MSEFYEQIRNNSVPDYPYIHIVTFSFPDTISKEEQRAIMEECAALGEACGGREAGIEGFLVRPNIDDRKGYTWVEIGEFKTVDDFINFHQHPAHKKFAEKIAEIADVWVVIDFQI